MWSRSGGGRQSVYNYTRTFGEIKGFIYIYSEILYFVALHSPDGKKTEKAGQFEPRRGPKPGIGPLFLDRKGRFVLFVRIPHSSPLPAAIIGGWTCPGGDLGGNSFEGCGKCTKYGSYAQVGIGFLHNIYLEIDPKGW